MILFLSKKVSQGTCKSALCVCAFALITLVLVPHHAQALSLGGLFGGGGGGDVVQDIRNTVQNTLQALSLSSIEEKELVIDGIMFEQAQKALQQMTGEIITWLNSGLDGNPAFVTDIEAQLQDVADEAAADFIYGDQLSKVCKPFETVVREALAKNHAEDSYEGFKKDAECTYGENINAQAFISGDFNAGGWSTWFEVVLNPYNTSAGVSIASRIELARIVDEKQAVRVKEWDWGRGVESKKSCRTVGTGANAQKKCTITTPGAILQELGTKALGTGIDSLLNADEANEVIGLLFGNLAKETITGINGMLGLGGNAQFSNNTFGTAGNLSYLDAIRQEQANKQKQNLGGNKIQQALATETRVLELQLSIVESISTTTRLFASSSAPYLGRSCFDLTIPTALSNTLSEISAKLPTSISTVLTLQDMAEEFASTTDTTGQLRLLEQLSTLQSNGLLNGQAAVVELDFFISSELRPFLADFRKKIAEEVKGCS
jgi:hypothetical protein